MLPSWTTGRYLLIFLDVSENIVSEPSEKWIVPVPLFMQPPTKALKYGGARVTTS